MTELLEISAIFISVISGILGIFLSLFALYDRLRISRDSKKPDKKVNCDSELADVEENQKIQQKKNIAFSRGVIYLLLAGLIYSSFSWTFRLAQHEKILWFNLYPPVEELSTDDYINGTPTLRWMGGRDLVREHRDELKKEGRISGILALISSLTFLLFFLYDFYIVFSRRLFSNKNI